MSKKYLSTKGNNLILLFIILVCETVSKNPSNLECLLSVIEMYFNMLGVNFAETSLIACAEMTGGLALLVYGSSV